MLEFVPKFYPTSISQSLMKKIVLEYYQMYECVVFDSDIAYEIENFYNPDVVQSLKFMKSCIKDNKWATMIDSDASKEKIVTESLGMVPEGCVYRLNIDLRLQWKHPDINRYHTFLQTFITDFDSLKEKKAAIDTAMYNVWRHIDVYPFLWQINKYFIFKKKVILGEIKRLERDYIQYFI